MDDQLRALAQQQIDNESKLTASGFDPASLPSMSAAMPSEANQHNFLYNAARSGWNNFQATTDQSVAAGLKMVGADDASAAWSKSAAEQSQEAQRFNMPELQAMPGDENFSWSNLPKQIAYTAVQNLPYAAMGAVGALGMRRFAPQAFEGSAAAAGAGRALGAMGIGEGAAATGAEALRNVAGAAISSYPTAVGSMYGEAVDRGEPTAGDAFKAALLGVPYSMLEGTEIATLGGLFKGAKTTVAAHGILGAAKGVAYDAGKAFLNEGFAEGAQTIMEQSFRPDLSVGERAHNVLNAMFLGGLGGLGMGAGASGAGHVLRTFNTVPADQIAQRPGAMADAVDATLGQPPSNPAAADAPIEPDATEPAPAVVSAPPAAAAAPGYDPARPYGHISNEELQARAAEAPKDGPVWQAINQEAATRVRELEAKQNGATTQTEREQLQKEFEDRLAKDAGLKGQQRRTLTGMNVGDDVSAYDIVKERMQLALEKGKNPPKALQQLNDYFGIFDAAGKERDLAAEMAVAQDAKATAPNAQVAAKANEHVAQLNTLLQRRQQLDEQRKASEDQRKAIEEERATAAKAQQEEFNLRELAARPLQAHVNEITKPMKAQDKSAFMSGVRGFFDGKEPTANATNRAGWQFAQRYSEAQKLVEKENGEAARSPLEQLAEAVRSDAAAAAARNDGAAAGASENAVAVPGEGTVAEGGQEGLAGGGLESPSVARKEVGAGQEGRQAAVPVQGQVNAAIPTVEAPESAQWAVKQFGAHPVWRDGELAILRGYRTNGEPMYRGIANGVISKEDLSKHSAMDATSQADFDKLKAAYAVVKAQDEADAKAYPDGPFTGATERVVSTPGVDKRLAGYTQELLKAVGINPRVYLTTYDEIRKGPVYSGYYAPINAAGIAGIERGSTQRLLNGDHWLAIDPNKSMTLNLETIAHEVGHILQKEAYYKQPVEVRNEIVRAYNKWREETDKRTMGEHVPNMRAYRSAQKTNMNGNEGVPVTHVSSYWRHFDEWFADQVARWAMTSEKPQTIVDKFFAKLGQALRRLYALATNQKYMPSQEMKKWLDARGPADISSGLENAAGELGPSVSSRQAAVASVSTTSEQAAPRSALETVQAVMNNVGQAIQNVTAAENNKKSTSWSEWFLKQHLGWTTLHHIAEHFGKYMPELRQLVLDQEHRRNFSNRWAAIALQATNQFDKLTPQVQEDVAYVMAMATELQLNPRAAWEKHTHLFKQVKEGKLTQERLNELKELHRQLADKYQGMKRNGGAKAYDMFLEMNHADRYAHHAVALARMMQKDDSVPSEIKRKIGDLTMDFLHRQNSNDSPTSLHEFWKKESDKIMALAKDYIKGADAALSQRQRSKAAELPVKALYNEFLQEQGRLHSYPYFKLGRFGEYFVAFDIKKLANGQLEPDALKKVQTVLDSILVPAGQRVIINPLSKHSKAYVRIDSVNLMNQLTAALKDHSLIENFKAGPRAPDHVTGPAQRLVTMLEKEVDESTAFEGSEAEVAKTKAQTKQFIQQFALDIMPDIAIEKSLAHREGVPGYSADMVRAFAHRSQQGGLSLARMAGSAKILDTLGAARQRAINANTPGNGDPILLNNLYNEAARREYLRAIEDHSSLIETLKALNHSYFLGFNPSHAMLQMVSIPVLLLPELGRRSGVGFTNASRYIGKATNDAFAVMSALGGEAWQAGAKKAPSKTITPETLSKAIKDAKLREFLMRVVNSGAIESGSESRELGRMAEGTGTGTWGHRLDLYTQYASAMGYYAETSTRLIAAISSYYANEGKNISDDAKFEDALKTISETMFNFSNYNVARMMGKNGFLGKATPLTTAFMSYSAQLMEKLYRETYKALGAGLTTPDEAKEARYFLLGHAAAVVAISGMMGLPFAGAFAAGIDKLKDWADPDSGPFDSRAWFRNHMNSIFGEVGGDVLARGLPRLTASDTTDRTGEASLFPFTQFMQDRGSWRDAFGRLEQRGFGSPAAAVTNILDGVDRLNAGDYMGGVRAFMPQGLKNMIDAYRMGDEGYMDAKGNKLPLTVGAEDQLRKLIGFKGDREADYNEVKQIDAREKTRLQQEAGPIMKNLLSALEKGDRETARIYFEQAQDYDRQHPTRALLPKLESRLRSTITNHATERMTGMPAGIQLQDPLEMQNLQWYQNRAR